VFLEVLSAVPSSLVESVLTRLPLKRLDKHSLWAGIMLLPLLAADLEALFCSVFVVVFAESWGCWGCSDEFAHVVDYEFKVTPLLFCDCVTSCSLCTLFLFMLWSLSLFSSLFTLYLKFVHDFSTLFALFKGKNFAEMFFLEVSRLWIISTKLNFSQSWQIGSENRIGSARGGAK